MWNYRNFDYINKQSDTYKNTNMKVYKYSNIPAVWSRIMWGASLQKELAKKKQLFLISYVSIFNFYVQCLILQTVDNFAADMLASYWWICMCIQIYLFVQIYLIKYTCVFNCCSQIYLCIQMGPVKCPHALELVSKFRYSVPFRRT